ncbi:hypothetical protein [Nonomuraea basaltis]|uniref:hypothetical protein n=1 Tax=Nonomuraea basaltis TaxID=2495887 RepID=UPI00110C43EF|nr:hypothetical protein [Nonomuraea basaltis]TMR97993.1 hypothetical protein EJK15_15175 [Nonomuraea basaltis]
MESSDRIPDAGTQYTQEIHRRLSAAHKTAEVARIVMGVISGMLGVLAMAASFMPTNYDWDSSMPDYTDVNMVTITAVSSGLAILFTAASIAFLWRRKIVVVGLILLVAVDIYRFATLVPHYS